MVQLLHYVHAFKSHVAIVYVTFIHKPSAKQRSLSLLIE